MTKKDNTMTNMEVKVGNVQFIKHKNKEIMYEPHFNEYYVNDIMFKTLDKAKAYIEKDKQVFGGHL
jgi:hypothetical protein|tara:strand:+ start:256 stop:453 length:198 start_codon:yes stop_codon:yes gene_type:complete